jgi:hypothetical protein
MFFLSFFLFGEFSGDLELEASKGKGKIGKIRIKKEYT